MIPKNRKKITIQAERNDNICVANITEIYVFYLQKTHLVRKSTKPQICLALTKNKTQKVW